MQRSCMYVACSFTLACSFWSAPGANAQTTVASTSYASQPPQAESVTPAAQRKVALQFHQTPLDRALKEIASQAGMRVSYSDAVAEKNAPVTWRTDTVTALQAMVQILQPRGFVVMVTADGKAFIVTELEKGRQGAVQKQGILTGKVVHAKTKQPLAGATVSIDGLSATTNSDGTFRLAVGIGEHTVQIRAVGFTRSARKINVTTDETVAIDVALDPTASVLEGVVVTGTVAATARKEISTPITVITAADIEKRGITRIEQLMRGEIPGLLALERGDKTFLDSLGNSVSSDIYSRGASTLGGGTNPIKTFIDGVELLDPSYLGTIDPSTIERIEVITGPQAATIYGSGAMGGVMQIFTKQGIGRTTPDLTLSMRYGMLENNFSDGRTPTHNDVLSAVGGAGSVFSYAVNGSYNYSGQWQPHLFTRRFGGSVGATHTAGPVTASGSVSLSRTTNGTFDGTYSTNLRNYQLRQDGVWTNTANWAALASSQRISSSIGQTVAMNVDYRATSFWQHRLTMGRTTNSFAQNPQAPRFTAGYTSSGGKDTLYKHTESVGERTTLGYNTSLSLRKFSILSSTLTLGANGSSGQERRTSGCTGTKTSSTYVPCEDAGITVLGISRTLNDQSWGGFGSWQLGLFGRVFLNLGLRAEKNPAYGRERKIDWTPSNGLAYTMELGDLSVKFLGSYGRATRPPNDEQRLRQLRRGYADYDVAEYEYNRENLKLRPEYSRGPQGGIEIYYGNLGSFTINRYQQTVSDLIQQVLIDTVIAHNIYDGSELYMWTYQYVNVAKVRQSGWESTAGVNVGRVNVRGSYSWNDSRILSLNPDAYGLWNGERDGMMFRGVPTHMANIVIGYAYGGTSVTMVTNYVGSVIGDGSYLGELWSVPASLRIKSYCECNMRLGNFWDLEVRKAGYTKSDMILSQRVSNAVSLTLNVMNLANSYGSELGSMNPALGRQTTAGVSIRFPK